MRHLLATAATVAALLVAGCGDGSPSAPAADDADVQAELTVLSQGLTRPGDPPAPFPELDRAPAALRLTDAQRAAMRAEVEEFRQATQADRAALEAIARRAVEARRNGATPDAVRLILAEGMPVRARIVAAEAALRAELLAILTVEQRAWLMERSRPRCSATVAPPLSDAQRGEIHALIGAFTLAHAEDLRAIAVATEQANLARRNGATPEQVSAILEPVRPVVSRVAAASRELMERMMAVLTPEQRASGCLGLLTDALRPGTVPPELLPFLPKP